MYGKKTGTFTVLGVLLAAELPAGTHTVEIVYRPLQLFIGFGVSLVAAGIWLFTAMRKKPATRPTRILRKGHDVG